MTTGDGSNTRKDALVVNVKEIPSGTEPKPTGEGPNLSEENQERVRALRETGNAHYRDGCLPEAVVSYTRGIHIDGRDKLLWANRAAAFLKLNAPADALRDAETALALDPTYGKAHHRRGRACLVLGRLDDAYLAFSEALRMECADAEDDLAIVNDVISAVDKARRLAIANRLVAAAEALGAVVPHVRMGEALVEEYALLALRAQLYEGIIVLVEPALSLKPLLHAHRTMGIVAAALYRLAFLDRAHAMFARALHGGDASNIASTNPSASFDADHFVHTLGLAADLDLCVAVRTHAKLGMHLQSEKKYDWAVECYSEALRTDGRTPSVRRWLYHLRGRARCYVAKEEEGKPWGAAARVLGIFNEAIDDLDAALGEADTADPQRPTHPEMGDRNVLVVGNAPRCSAAPSGGAFVGVGARGGVAVGACGLPGRGGAALVTSAGAAHGAAVGADGCGDTSGDRAGPVAGGGVPLTCHWLLEALRWRAFARHFKGDFKRAIGDYNAILEVDPSDARAASRLRELRYMADADEHVDEQPNYYTILGVPRTATLPQIRTAYAAAVVSLHPDRSRTALAAPPEGEGDDADIIGDDDDELARRDAALARAERLRDEAVKRQSAVTLKLVEVHEALSVLSDPQLRRMYDRTGYPLHQLQIALRDGDERFQAFTGVVPLHEDASWRDKLKYHLSKMWFYGIQYPCVACRERESFLDNPEVPRDDEKNEMK